MFSTILVFASVILGIFAGIYIIPESIILKIDSISTLMLGLLIFSVGIDIGNNRDAFSNIKSKGVMVISLVASAILGSAIGGIIMSLIYSFSFNTSLSITAGYGWYSLSGLLLKDLAGSEIGAIAFLTNVFREILAFALIPILATKKNHFVTILPSGATAMDTTLPLLSRSIDSEMTIVAFLSGVALTSLVPIMVPFFFSL